MFLEFSRKSEVNTRIFQKSSNGSTLLELFSGLWQCCHETSWTMRTVSKYVFTTYSYSEAIASDLIEIFYCC